MFPQILMWVEDDGVIGTLHSWVGSSIDEFTAVRGQNLGEDGSLGNDLEG